MCRVLLLGYVVEHVELNLEKFLEKYVYAQKNVNEIPKKLLQFHIYVY